jgi:hypothetical protein
MIRFENQRREENRIEDGETGSSRWFATPTPLRFQECGLAQDLYKGRERAYLGFSVFPRVEFKRSGPS